ncbi:hypothetical protein [Qipengyuania sp. DGS5-3]|uniref:hypothetical protein n=1 Tax=Qipengyuania sp. DGS5-3 TaxID=3349632 RepID=UPI0036D236BB
MTELSASIQQTHATLYHYPMACSTAVRIAAAEAKIDLRIELVDVYSKDLHTGGSFFAINPLGQVPTLVLPSGEMVTENVAVMYWIENQRGVQVSVQTVRWLAFCAAELHKAIIWPLARGEPDERTRKTLLDRFTIVSAHLNAHLDDRRFIATDRWSVADAYLLWCVRLFTMLALEMPARSAVNSYVTGLREWEHVSQIFAEDVAHLTDLRAAVQPSQMLSNPVYSETAPLLKL